MRAFLGRREGMTLLEVLLTLAIFLAGSVGIIGLFVAAGVLHSDAVGRRTASYIAETLLANVEAKPMHEVFAKTTINNGGSTLVHPQTAIPVVATAATATSPIAQFSSTAPFPLILQSEQVWANAIVAASPAFTLSAGTSSDHPDGSPVLQPRTWNYVLTSTLPYANTAINVNATGTPLSSPYIVIDKEWIKCSSYTATGGGGMTWNLGGVVYTGFATSGFGSFSFATNGRGFGGTFAAQHNVGAPVTVAQEYPGYPGFYYTVQYYPVNATGAEARVIVMVGFGTEKRFHVEAFEGVYTPSQY